MSARAILLLALLGACHRGPRAEVPELSGLVASRAHPGMFWAHGDSGNDPDLFAIDAQARTHAVVSVEGASYRDWEDIALDDQGNLYVGDIGNNMSERDDLAIHVLREPDPRVPTQIVRPVRSLRFRYPDQRDAKGKRVPARNFDAEALFVLANQLYLLTKQLGSPRTSLYRVPLDRGDDVTLERLGDFSIQVRKKQKNGLVTAASESPDGRMVAVLTYLDVFLFRVGGARVLEGPVYQAKAPDVNGLEALTWDARGLLLGAENGTLVRAKPPSEPVQLRD